MEEEKSLREKEINKKEKEILYPSLINIIISTMIKNYLILRFMCFYIDSLKTNYENPIN
jgi:hypothetical protein